MIDKIHNLIISGQPENITVANFFVLIENGDYSLMPFFNSL